MGQQNASAQDLIKLAETSVWKNLLHFRGNKSEADGLAFFFSSQGKYNAYSELQATVAQFQSSKERQKALCAYPARARFVRENIIKDLPIPSCALYDEWKKQFQTDRMSFVYVAGNMGDPASLFGHTFLKLRSQYKAKLLEHIVTFEANSAGDSGSVGYALKGLLGFYPGVFSVQPYHLKINQYSRIEGRDLEEYDLDLTPLEIEKLLEHLWELANTYFDYYFFDENCSYHLLSLLEVARPGVELRSQFKYMAIPSDVLWVVKKEFVHTPAVIRQSLISKMNTQFAKFGSEQKERFQILWENSSLATTGDSIETIDLLIDWEHMRALKEQQKLFDVNAQIPSRLLLLRSKMNQPIVAEMPIEKSESQRAHESSRLVASVSTKNSYGLELRPAYHDFTDSTSGYLPNSRLIVGRVAIETRDSQFRLSDLTFADVGTLDPGTELFPKWAWLLGGGFSALSQENSCFGCLKGRFRGAFGKSVGKTVVSYLLATGSIEGSSVFRDKGRLETGFQSGFLIHIAENIKFMASWEWSRYFFDPNEEFHHRPSAEFQVSLDHLVLGLNYSKVFDSIRSADEMHFLLGTYF
jgi:hypothetical protein